MHARVASRLWAATARPSHANALAGGLNSRPFSQRPLQESVETLTESGADLLIKHAEAHAEKIGVGMNIAVVDAHLHLLAFKRMKGAKITSIDISMTKAYTAAGHRQETRAYKEAVCPGGPAFGIHTTNQGKFNIIGGGVPLFDEDNKAVIGAIGVSSGTPAQDHDVCENAIAAFYEARGSQ
eukprot:TRINITY_DN2076_c0_g1_i1.p1 TRINITY_DN2076_c0_g1~~TRINITY_DN2076_c0_g1_i1.p1  ORF type:complete len:198 (+),score=50.27 TRINITY_DN2076_c0_g1_i1:50-595(+)